MFPVLCVLGIITVMSCVSNHDQAMVMKTACPGGVNTFLYLKHPVSFITFYTQQVSLPCTNRNCANKRKQKKPQKFQMNKHGLVFIVCDFSIANHVEAFDLLHPKKSFVWPVSNRCRRSLNLNSIVLISYIFDFCRLSADFMSNLCNKGLIVKWEREREREIFFVKCHSTLWKDADLRF